MTTTATQHEVSVVCGDALTVLRRMPARSVELIFTSPPYALKTERYPGARRKMSWREWSAWMAEVVAECCRVCSGFVLVVANDPVRGGETFPANDLLRLTCFERGIHLERPVIWHKNSPPNKRPWWVNCWEPILGFYGGVRPTTWN